MARIILTGYLVRCPLGGYAWQAAHFLLGLRRLGHDVWFYEDTGHYAPAYNPLTDELMEQYDYGLATAATFLDRLGFSDRWVFADVHRGLEYGPGAGRAASLVWEADLIINLAGVNYIPLERRGGRPALYIDLDPAYTQIKLANGDALLKEILDEHQFLATFGENIGTTRSPVPTCGYDWHPTRQPVVLDCWSGQNPCRQVYTTVGHWDSNDRDISYQEQTYSWRKRLEWLNYIDLPTLSGQEMEIAMDVWRIPEDHELLRSHGWRIVEPRSISTDFWVYRDYLVSSRGEFTVAKGINVQLRSGWFSDRAACYLAAGRPVVEQDTGFGDVLPLGPGLHAFCTIQEATNAFMEIEADYRLASAYAQEIAREFFDTNRVLRSLLTHFNL